MSARPDDSTTGVEDLLKVTHRAVQNVGDDIEGLRFNRAVAQIYELSNALAKFEQGLEAGASAPQLAALRDGIVRLVQLIAPMMPHLAETCWAELDQPGLVIDAPWPSVESRYLVDSSVVVAVQVNGKLRGVVEAPVDATQEVIARQAREHAAVRRALEGQEVQKIIVAPGRLVNFLTSR